jgi:hypothetical protein
MRIAELRKAGDILYRDGMAEMAMKEISNFDGSYKGAMELCGKLSVIAKMATCDDYWSEQVNRGQYKQEFEAKRVIRGTHELARNKTNTQ